MDATNCDSSAYPKMPVIATIAGQDLPSGPNAGVAKEGWTFIAVMKRNNEVQLWIGNPGDKEPQKVRVRVRRPVARESRTEVVIATRGARAQPAAG